MKMTKRLLLLVLASIMALSVFSACGNEEVKGDKSVDETVIRIGGLKGPTTMGLVKLMEDAANSKTTCNYEFTVEAAADAITPLLIKGELDMIAIPANVASVLYNKTNGGVKVLAINTLGVLYIVERGNSIESVSDLKGKTIYATGKGTTPEYSLRYILSKNGLDPDKDVEIVWKTEPTEVVGLLSNNEGGVAMLPQPFVTVACAQNEALSVIFDMDEQWNKAQGENGSSTVTGVTVVRNEFLKENEDAVMIFLTEHKKSAEAINADPAKGATLAVEAGIIAKEPIAQKAIPNCNIVCITGEEVQKKLEAYLTVLYEQSPEAVGGKLPAQEFYY